MEVPQGGLGLLLPLTIFLLIFGLFFMWKGVKREIPVLVTWGKAFTIVGILIGFRTVQVVLGPILDDIIGHDYTIFVLVLIGIGFIVLVWFVLFYPETHPFKSKMFVVHCLDCGKPFKIKQGDIETRIRCEDCEKER